MVKAEWSAKNNAERITPSLGIAFLIQFCSSALCFLDIAPSLQFSKVYCVIKKSLLPHVQAIVLNATYG
ncbi:hypothetical protein P029_02830 [Anaplasma phagocytophilum str. Norway variant2]|uniref:Uncharacterized protein n=1 Tax=Anaplasma phagocytophilum str. Norway variant2 TaxID=1392507 RepID=A0A168HBQ0_ANAPH|nr:hypothetical protein P029_02830 [Anaplasma phagocytophilum str. Norway variant2]